MFFFEVGDHLALHVQLGLGLLDSLGRNASGLVDRQQAVVVVLDGLQLHQLLVLRGIERHDELPPRAPDRPPRRKSCRCARPKPPRSDVVLPCKASISEVKTSVAAPAFGNGVLVSTPLSSSNGGHALSTRAAGERDGGDYKITIFFTPRSLSCFLLHDKKSNTLILLGPKGLRRASAMKFRTVLEQD